MDAPLIVARVAVRASRAAWRAVPAVVRRQVEDRVFYAVFHLTRVENDAYGWRPPEPGAGPPAGADEPASVATPGRTPP